MLSSKRFSTHLLIIGLILSLSGCAHTATESHAGKFSGNLPKSEPLSCYGNPDHYDVEGKRYHVLNTAKNYNKIGVASWYGDQFHGKLTSTRETYDMYGMTAASPELPLPTYVRVTNLENGHSVVLKVNDRGPFKSDRILDVSFAAAQKLGIYKNGTAKVRVAAIHNDDPQSLNTLTARRILQVGAFAQRENADQYGDKISQITQSPVKISESMADNRRVYRVEVGPFEDQAALESTQKLLQMHGVINAKARYS